jgi:hypothetical protein
MRHQHPRMLGDEHFAHELWTNPLHALASAVAALTGQALSGSRVESLTIMRKPKSGFWRVIAETAAPTRDGLDPVDDIARNAARFAPHILFREPLGGAGYVRDQISHLFALDGYASPAEGLDAEIKLRWRGLTVALAAAGPLSTLLLLLNETDFMRTETFARKDGEDGWAFDLFQMLDALTDAADPDRTPAQNLIAAIQAFSWEKVREIPARMELPSTREDAEAVEAAKGILRSVSLMGALLPDETGRLREHSLKTLQSYRDRARERYDAILAGPGLSDTDRDFLIMNPPRTSAWLDVLLGSTKGTGQEPIRLICAGFLAFWEATVITRAMDWAGDPMRQEADAPLPITECYNAWAGFRSGRWVPCLSS